MESFIVGGYWGSRHESSLECSERLTECLARLATVDESLRSWFRRGRAESLAKEPVPIDRASLDAVLTRGCNRRDVDGAVIDELGFSVGLWNRRSPPIGLSGTFGASPRFAGVLNHFVLDLPLPDGEGSKLYEPGLAEEIIVAIVETWEPDWATWVSPSLRAVQNVATGQPVVGWMTFLSTPRAAAAVDVGVDCRTLAGGRLLVLGADATRIAGADVLKLRQRLLHVGALEPTSDGS